MSQNNDLTHKPAIAYHSAAHKLRLYFHLLKFLRQFQIISAIKDSVHNITYHHRNSQRQEKLRSWMPVKSRYLSQQPQIKSGILIHFDPPPKKLPTTPPPPKITWVTFNCVVRYSLIGIGPAIPLTRSQARRDNIAFVVAIDFDSLSPSDAYMRQ